MHYPSPCAPSAEWAPVFESAQGLADEVYDLCYEADERTYERALSHARRLRRRHPGIPAPVWEFIAGVMGTGRIDLPTPPSVDFPAWKRRAATKWENSMMERGLHSKAVRLGTEHHRKWRSVVP